METIGTLNESLGIAAGASELSFSEGPGGLPVANISSPQGQATIALQGAHLIDYRSRDSHQAMFWLSRRSHFSPGKAIRGGIPICWPWFGAHPQDSRLPAHGLARTALWRVSSSRHLSDDGIEIVFSMPALPPPFPDLRLQATFRIGRQLDIALETTNHSDSVYQLSQALHSYFLVSDCEQVGIDGLDGCEYIDKTDNNRHHRQSGAPLISGEFDRIYLATDGACRIDDPGLQRSLRISARNSASTVVWNPGAVKAAAMADIGKDGFRHMLCVETANAASDSVTIAAGDSHRLSVRYEVSPLP